MDGKKTGFCLMDSMCPGGRPAKYTCSYQGVSAGCQDAYVSDLSCQWVDITDLPASYWNQFICLCVGVSCMHLDWHVGWISSSKVLRGCHVLY